MSIPESAGRCLAAVLIVMGIAVAGIQTPQAAPVIAKPSGSPAVSISETTATWTLDNGIVKVTVNKTSGNFRSLVYRGTETMGAGGSWEETPGEAAKVGGLTRSITIDPAKNGGERAEVSVKGITGGKIGLSPGSPGAPATGTFNLDIEIRTSLARGDSGVYTYAVFSHPKDYGPLNMPESRFITFISKAFDWISVDKDRNMLEAAPTDWGTGVVVHAKEQRIMSKGVYKNSVEHKYSYNAVQYKIPAYGWSSTSKHLGIWFINPSIEYLSGGATKQELVCHYHDNANPDPVILDYWRGTHYGGGATAAVSEGEDWKKVIGPIFVYVNELSDFETPSQSDLDTLKATEGNPTIPKAWTNNATALWQDALARAKQEKAEWPYKWVEGVDYPHQDERGSVTGQLVLDDSQAASKELAGLTVGLAHPDYARSFGGGRGGAPRAGGAARGGAGRGAFGARGGDGATSATANARGGFARGGAGRGGAAAGARGGFGGGNALVDWAHDAKFYQFWNDGSEDGKFALTNVRPGTYTLHAFATGVLGEFAQTSITVVAGKTVDLGKLDWKPIRYGKQVWEIGYPDRTGGKFFKGDPENYWLWGWGLRYPLLFPNDITYTIGKSDYHKDWFFQQTPHSETTAWKNPDAKDPANQRFGWVKAESLDEYPQTNTRGPWAIYGQGRETTWTVKFNMDQAPKGEAALRIALAGADSTVLTIGVNGKEAGQIRPVSTNALRYNTDKSVWYEYTQKFDASMMKQGENTITLTVPAGDLTTGVVYDYLRLELDENAKPEAPASANAGSTSAQRPG